MTEKLSGRPTIDNRYSHNWGVWIQKGSN